MDTEIKYFQKCVCDLSLSCVTLSHIFLSRDRNIKPALLQQTNVECVFFGVCV